MIRLSSECNELFDPETAKVGKYYRFSEPFKAEAVKEIPYGKKTRAPKKNKLMNFPGGKLISKNGRFGFLGKGNHTFFRDN